MRARSPARPMSDTIGPTSRSACGLSQISSADLQCGLPDLLRADRSIFRGTISGISASPIKENGTSSTQPSTSMRWARWWEYPPWGSRRSTAPSSGHAFRTAPDRPINPLTDDLGSLAPGEGSGASAINDLGQVAGSAPVSTARHGQQDHAFRTGPDQPINPLTDDLGTLGGIWSRATHINNRGDVAGTADVDSTTRHAFLYTRQTMVDLNDCVELEPGWHLEDVLDLKDSGVMLARASNVQIRPWEPQFRSYLLVPAPQGIPTVALLLGMGATGSSVLFRPRAWRAAMRRLLARSLALVRVASRPWKGGHRTLP